MALMSCFFILFYFSLSDFVGTTRVTVRAIHSPN